MIPEERAVAFTYDGGSYAVMMATPQDFDDFAVGFSLTEQIIGSPDDIESLEVITEELESGEHGIELRMRLEAPRSAIFRDRRRRLAGPTGCGLCGIETLSDALRPVPFVAGGRRIAAEEILHALEAIGPAQSLFQDTRAVHAAAFWQHHRGLVAIREDVGRHNALDKLAGALARGRMPATDGIIILTSRVSVEMVQKAAVIGAPIIVAISAPTGLALRSADACGITLIAVARRDGFEVFTHPHRIAIETEAHVA